MCSMRWSDGCCREWRAAKSWRHTWAWRRLSVRGRHSAGRPPEAGGNQSSSPREYLAKVYVAHMCGFREWAMAVNCRGHSTQ